VKIEDFRDFAQDVVTVAPLEVLDLGIVPAGVPSWGWVWVQDQRWQENGSHTHMSAAHLVLPLSSPVIAPCGERRVFRGQGHWLYHSIKIRIHEKREREAVAGPAGHPHSVRGGPDGGSKWRAKV